LIFNLIQSPTFTFIKLKRKRWNGDRLDEDGEWMKNLGMI
jgi:hypothetical protein